MAPDPVQSGGRPRSGLFKHHRFTEDLPALLAIDNLPPGVFSYRYRNFRIDEAYEQEAHRHRFLMRFFEFLNSEPFLAFARAVTGVSEIAFADAQAPYRSGDFLSVHDDNVVGKKRYAAYVFNFTPTWRPEWGAFLPSPMNLVIFMRPLRHPLTRSICFVPIPHLVTQVASTAQEGRYSITGSEASSSGALVDVAYCLFSFEKIRFCGEGDHGAFEGMQV